MVQFMFAACQQHQEEQHKKRFMVWARMLAGLTFIGLAIAYLLRKQTVPQAAHQAARHAAKQAAQHVSPYANLWKFAAIGLLAAGAIYFCLGLWRAVMGPRRLRAEDLCEAWEKQEE